MLSQLRSLKIRTKLMLVSAVFAAGVATFGGLFLETFNTLRVNGSVYQEVIQGKDVVADILPPPLYVIEPYLTILQAVSQDAPLQRKSLVARYRKLRSEYDERRQYWQTNLPEGDVKRLLTEESFVPAKEFFDIAENELLPALEKGDSRAAARIAHGTLNRAYEAHRAKIDQLVDVTNRQSEATEKMAAATTWSRLAMLGAVCAAVVALVLALSLYVARDVSRSIGGAVSLLAEVAKGNISVEVPADMRRRGDEIGRLGQAVAAMTTGLRETVRKLAENAKALAISSTGLSATATQLSGGAQETTAQSTTVASAAEKLSANMSNMSATGEQMSASVKVVASSIDQMTASIGEVAKNAEQAASVAANAAQLAAESNRSISELGSAADEIGKVVEVIQDIAEQTSLLALNATIEAARAGEAGKGFAVVASEVKELAKQTGAATEDIRRRIEAIQGTTTQAVRAIGGVGQVIDQVNEVSRTIASAVEEQSVTTKEIARSIVQAATAVEAVAVGITESAVASEEISKNIGSVTSIAHHTAMNAETTFATSTDLFSTTEQLQAIVSRFEVEHGRFDAAPIKLAHQKWRVVLANMIAGRSPLQTKDVKDHTQCVFGKWYAGEGKSRFGHLPLFQSIRREHEQVHVMARAIVEMYSRGDKQQAAAMLSDMTPLTERLCGMLDELEQHSAPQLVAV